ncbi:leukocidin family pore-forming toxin [Aliivibrio sifiae]|uniref:Hemolysin n=1 Tax=Aliivibrio sifiae TaxID=566293 RepID=A0A2S7XJD9_9GAMM|nr:leukocidin family pore-forming toxin [Aliivibrio sifiae]PQJ93713.1 hypothetical protein BTO23_06380 [Aliivibrio sifiae]GLR74177.1 hemolysin [Aliivibrio sifiae]
MKKSLICCLISLCFNGGAVAYEDVADGAAVSMLSRLQNQDVIYIDAKNWNESVDNVIKYTDMNNEIVGSNKKYLIDFSRVTDPELKEKKKSLLRNNIGLSFEEDFLIITRHKGKLMFSPLNGENDANLFTLDSSDEYYPPVAALSSSENESGKSGSLPHVSFYLEVNKQITDAECSFPNSLVWDRGSRTFCNNGNISLIYQVILERSLQFGTSAAATPDAKIVRISLDDNTSGTGIHLNEQLSERVNNAGYQVVSGWAIEWSASAIAQDYLFDFSASNKKAQILKTFPRENINANYSVTESSGFNVGVSAGAEVSAEGPKGSLQANASYNQTKSLTFNTSDYRVERNSNSPNHVSFKWNREQYATSESLLASWTNPVWVTDYPVDLGLVKPIGYASFVPKFDVIYKASPNETGTTVFTIDSSVNMRPIYNRSWYYFYGIGAHQTYYGVEDSPLRRINKPASFTVDWDHPVFTGGRPVNLQLASFNSRCINADENGNLSPSICSSNSVTQSFIYDQYNRYASAVNTKKCLDGQNLTTLNSCNFNLSQRWEWHGDKLQNVYVKGDVGTAEYLSHNKLTGKIGLSTEENTEQGIRTITSYTSVFEPSNVNNKSLTIFADTDYSGDRLSIQDSISDLENMNNRLSSYTIPDGWEVIFFEGKNFTGGFYTRNSSSSYASDFNDSIESIRINRQ